MFVISLLENQQQNKLNNKFLDDDCFYHPRNFMFYIDFFMKKLSL